MEHHRELARFRASLEAAGEEGTHTHAGRAAWLPSVATQQRGIVDSLQRLGAHEALAELGCAGEGHAESTPVAPATARVSAPGAAPEEARPGAADIHVGETYAGRWVYSSAGWRYRAGAWVMACESVRVPQCVCVCDTIGCSCVHV